MARKSTGSPAKSRLAASGARPASQEKLLVANRSEIAIRVFRAATELGLRTVAIYAEEDRFSMHRFKADESYIVGSGKGPVGAYLDIESVVRTAHDHGVRYIHPGYGFLSENPEFASACAEAGLVFVGPRPELLALMGDKVAARAKAHACGVSTLPGTPKPVRDRTRALESAKKIGFPLIIKAAHGGGGRGMRIVREARDLERLLDEAQTEAGRAFGNPEVFLEKFVPRAKHIEVQILGDRHGNIVHLHERDCSVQRRHQKVVEVAPAVNLSDATRGELCDAAVRLAATIGYDNAGTVEFLVDAGTEEWFFIEMNPRIQVEHTVTEEITGIDIVRAQILIARGEILHAPIVGIPAQADVPREGHALQCRITTEDPENGFTPDYGKIITFRSASGLGVRLDAGMGDAGSVITPFYDSLLVKITAWAPTFEMALARMKRSLREFRIRGVKTNIPFLENVIDEPVFREGNATTSLIDTTPRLFEFAPRRDRATKLLAYLGDIIVNGNPHAKGYQPAVAFPPARIPNCDLRQSPPEGARQLLQKLGPQKFGEWARAEKRLLLTDTTLRDAHQSLMATRMRTYDMVAVADAIARRTPELFSLEMWGGATFDTAMRFLREDPWNRLRELRERIPNICFQMLLRGSNAVGYSNYPDNVVTGFVERAAAGGIDIFRVFDSLNYLPNMKPAMRAVRDAGAVCEAAICYTGNILGKDRPRYSLDYYLRLAADLQKSGAHILCIKDMAGLCRPYAAEKLVRALRKEIDLPIHFHTHDTSGVNAASILKAAEAGVDIADAAIASMSGSTSQPNLNSIVAALQDTPRATRLDLDTLNEFSDYWEQVRNFYAPFDTAPRTGSAEVYLHEMPGGQVTNLKEQAASMGIGHRWPEVARTYAEVNQLFGDIVKVTPSSKVVGDMTMFLVTRNIRAADVLNLPPGTAFPESVIDMLAGGLGQPDGGWPKKLQRVVLGNQKSLTGRPGAHAAPVDLAKTRKEIEAKLHRMPDDDDLYSYLMYPQVFLEFAKSIRDYSDLSVLPTPAFFYGLKAEEEITVHIEPGKTLFIKLLNVTPADKDGRRVLNFELNGVARQTTILDRSVQPERTPRQKADPADAKQIGAPIPGAITAIAVNVGTKVVAGAKLITLEAMKMHTTITAPEAGVVREIHAQVGDRVESKDLLLRLG
jgi:pyruvate carboxylase